MTAPLSRRRALSGAATVGVGAPLLAACSARTESTAGDSADASTAPTRATPTPSASGSATAISPGAHGTARGLVATADVPLGGGVVLPERELVVTQPSEGEFRAFSAICTHSGCLVGSVAEGTITCACHNSMFSAADGSVTGGPAPTRLPAVAVRVAGGQVVKA
jgi:Rieske Fe-S protein